MASSPLPANPGRGTVPRVSRSILAALSRFLPARSQKRWLAIMATNAAANCSEAFSIETSTPSEADPPLPRRPPGAPARLAFLVDMVGRDDLVNAVALNSVLFNVARAAGPAAAGVLLEVLSPGACFLLNAVSYVAVLVALTRIRAVGALRQVGADRRVLLSQHQLEPLEEHRLHFGQVAGVLVGRPPPRRRATLA